MRNDTTGVIVSLMKTTTELATNWQGQFDGMGGLDATKRPLTDKELADLNAEFDKFESEVK